MEKSPLKLLAVEDNPADVRLLMEVLHETSSMEFELLGASTLKEAVDLLVGGTIDMVLLDLNLPDSQGLESLDRIKAIPTSPAVIVLTGLDDRETALHALAHNAQDYLVKGKITSDALERCIRYSLERERIDKEMRVLNAELEKRVEELRLANDSLQLARHTAVGLMEDALISRADAEREKSTLEAMMEALPVGVAILDARGEHIKSNNAYRKVWGEPSTFPRSLADYKSLQAFWGDGGRQVDPHEWASSLVLEHGVPITGQILEIERRDGSRASVINNAAPVTDARGEVIGVVVTIQDVTELRGIEKALRQARGELEQRDQEQAEELESG